VIGNNGLDFWSDLNPDAFKIHCITSKIDSARHLATTSKIFATLRYVSTVSLAEV